MPVANGTHYVIATDDVIATVNGEQTDVWDLTAAQPIAADITVDFTK